MDDDTIKVSNVLMKNFDLIYLYDEPHEQRDGSLNCSVTNNAKILHNEVWYDEKNKPAVHVRCATSGLLIVSVAIGLLQV